MRERILIRNADAVGTCDPADRGLYNSDILICGNRIEAVGSNLAAGDAQLTLDMTELGFPVPGGEVVVSPGSLALFTTEGDDLYATFSLDLNAPAIPEGSLDQAVLLHTEVVYTGSAFGLNAPSLSVPEI